MRGNRRMTQQKSNNEFEVKWKKKALKKNSRRDPGIHPLYGKFSKNDWSSCRFDIHRYLFHNILKKYNENGNMNSR